jgi:hypothetical protein
MPRLNPAAPMARVESRTIPSTRLVPSTRLPAPVLCASPAASPTHPTYPALPHIHPRSRTPRSHSPHTTISGAPTRMPPLRDDVHRYCITNRSTALEGRTRTSSVPRRPRGQPDLMSLIDDEDDNGRRGASGLDPQLHHKPLRRTRGPRARTSSALRRRPRPREQPNFMGLSNDEDNDGGHAASKEWLACARAIL